MEASLSKVVLQIVRVLVNPQSTFKGDQFKFLATGKSGGLVTGLCLQIDKLILRCLSFIILQFLHNGF